MTYLSDFLNFLDNNNVSLTDFCLVIIGILIALYVVYHFPFWLISLCTFLLVIFGVWTDKKRDKFLWHQENYLYRTCLNLYDDKGYCTKTIYYKYVTKKYGGK